MVACTKGEIRFDSCGLIAFLIKKQGGDGNFAFQDLSSRILKEKAIFHDGDGLLLLLFELDCCGRF